MRSRDTHIVSANDVADYAFCPESFRLKLTGAMPSRPAQAQMAAGTRAHAVWTRAGRRETGRCPALLALFVALLIAALVALVWVS